MDDQTRIALAHQATTMLGNDAFRAALARHRQALLERFAAPDSTPARWPELHAELQALLGLEASLASLMTDGQAIEAHRRVRTSPR